MGDPPLLVGGVIIVNVPCSRYCESTNDRYAVAASIAAFLKPAPKFPSLIFPIKNPEIQH